MGFRIREVKADGEWVALTDNRSQHSSDNIFTLVVGQNAVGKSRLLRKIVSNYLFNNEDRIFTEGDTNFTSTFIDSPYEGSLKSNRSFFHSNPATIDNRRLFYGDEDDYVYGQEVRCSEESYIRPANIIAVSTGRHDRFPSPSHNNRKSTRVDYHYIGTENKSGSNITSSLTALLEGLLDGRRKIDHLTSIFDYLGFAPYLDIKLTLDKRQMEKALAYSRKAKSYEAYKEVIEFLNHEENTSKGQDYDVSHIFHELRAHGKSSIEISFLNSHIAGRHALIDLIPLLKAEVVKISDVTLFVTSGKSRMRLSQASSGQQCMLTIVLGIAGVIQHGSLICIDEPEISLHPGWQSSIVSQLQKAFSEYHGCHFIIATHSPQIVSGLTTENGYVLNLEDKKLYHSHEYAKRSADFQLAEIFRTPGFNNEYLVRITLLWLTKLSRRDRLTRQDRSDVEDLIKVRELLSDTDPVYHLIGQVEALY